jgi:hypothetical protein
MPDGPDEEYGDERLRELPGTPAGTGAAAMLERLMGAVLAHTGGAAQADGEARRVVSADKALPL